MAALGRAIPIRKSGRALPARPAPIRILTAVPICDGHDSAINTINLELIRHGIEVIYLGYHRSVGDIVRAAIQEDVRAIGISSYNGGHIEFFAEVVDLLRKRGADDVPNRAMVTEINDLDSVSNEFEIDRVDRAVVPIADRHGSKNPNR